MVNNGELRGRRILNSQALIAIIIGVIVIAHEIADLVVNTRYLGRSILTEQIISATAALVTVLAGIVTYLASRPNHMRSLRCMLILGFVLSLAATILLAVTLGLFVPRAWGLWHAANQTPNDNYLTPLASDPYGPSRNGPQVLIPLSYHDQYYLKVSAILRIVALLGDGLLIPITLVCAILSIINVSRANAIGSYQRAAINDPNNGPQIYR